MISTRSFSRTIELILLLVGYHFIGSASFSAPAPFVTKLSTRTAPPRERRETEKKRFQQESAPFDFKTSRKGSLEKGSQLYGPLEYLVDDTTQNRSEDDMFHILLLGSTFDKPRITVNYVAGCLSYVIDMSEQDGVEHSVFAEENGFSCLGTWIRKDCLSLGQKLQARDIACRVVPFVTGGFNPWQAKYAEGESISSSPGGDLPASDFL